jgi:hypothetical protein
VRRPWRKCWVRAAVYALVLVPPSVILLAAYTSRPHDDGPLPAIAGVSYVSRFDPDFTRVAQEAAGKGEVRCWSSTAWPERASEFVRFDHMRIAHGQTAESVIPAYLSPGRKRINISGKVCNGLGRFLAGGPVDGEAAYGARVVGQMTGI